ncbi:ubiquitin-conjugating enzyme/RWD-like protein [Polychytrium aggregatum]|uniref:ubiquitin-conjugating enzyme/RWD-like protein n=1 Tax=Polychytrium aggregatum TaxID=110093 RepID=UPI0022FDC9B8|nr:ubiquitin-conjugating enzyme/RWD-like protein [Polychytrium aggregatum]KAI9208641.1 ubiquitin-conjugating enzyme/RWD-like protein [Polychytrium aggregatum]
MDPVSKRLLKELADCRRSLASQQPAPEMELIAELGPIDDEDLFAWKAVLNGPLDSPYQGGQFEVLFHIPPQYPIHPPSAKFTTTICHPNVHFKAREICLDILKDAWSPTWTIASTCVAIGVLLTSPEPNSPLNCDAANLLRCGDTRGYNSLVRMYTLLHAMPRS